MRRKLSKPQETQKGNAMTRNEVKDRRKTLPKRLRFQKIAKLILELKN